MVTRFEIAKFSDGRKKLLLRFFINQSNFRKEVNDEYTWCPSIDEVEQLRDTLEMTDFYNSNKAKIRIGQNPQFYN